MQEQQTIEKIDEPYVHESRFGKWFLRSKTLDRSSVRCRT